MMAETWFYLVGAAACFAVAVAGIFGAVTYVMGEDRGADE